MKNILLVILLSFSWVFIYFLFKYLRKIFSMLFFDLPFKFDLFFWRWSKGIESLRKQLLNKSKSINNEIVDKKIKLVDKKIAKIEYVFYSKEPSNFFVNFFLSKGFIKYYKTRVIKNNTKNLELDYSILSAFSSNKEKQESSFLNIKYNPDINEDLKNEILNTVKSNIKDEKFKELFEYN